MKILHVIPSISRVHGGPSVAVETMTRGLAGAGAAVEVATTDDDGAGHLNVPLGEPVLRAGVPHWFFRRQTQFYKFSLPLTMWLRQNIKNYDVVQLHALFTYSTMPAAYAAARAGVPYIVHPLGTLNPVGMNQYHPGLKRVSFPLLERRIIEGAAFVHYTSALEQAQAQAMGVTRQSVVIPIGVPVDSTPNESHKIQLRELVPQFADRMVFLFLGRLDPIKGFDLLLPAFAGVCAQSAGVGLILAGEGEPGYENVLRMECTRLGIARDVFFAGYVDGDVKRAFLRESDVFVLPSRSENQGVAVVEALAAGLPVLVTPGVGIAQEIAASGAGAVVARESGLLAAAMLQLQRNENARREMGAQGKRLAQEKFSVEAMTRALLNMYSQAIGARAGA